VGTLEAHFASGALIDAEALEKAGLLKARKDGLKILGAGELKKALTVKAHRVSQTARAAIEKAGGKVELIADKELKLPARGSGVRARISKERAARRAGKKK
jgi:ribosomal protein L15